VMTEIMYIAPWWQYILFYYWAQLACLTRPIFRS